MIALLLALLVPASAFAPPPAADACPGVDRGADDVVAVLLDGAHPALAERGMSGGPGRFSIGHQGRWMWAYVPRGDWGGTIRTAAGDMHFDQLMAVDEEIARGLGVTGDAALVSFVPNCGRGGFGGQGAVMRGVRVLDGRPGHPDVSEVLEDRREAVAQWLAEHHAEVEARLEAERTKLVGDTFDQPSTEVVPWVWWQDDLLHVRLRLQRRVHPLGYTCGIPLPDPGACRGPVGEAVVQRVFTWRIDPDRAAISEELGPVESWAKQYPPAGQAGGAGSGP